MTVFTIITNFVLIIEYLIITIIIIAVISAIINIIITATAIFNFIK